MFVSFALGDAKVWRWGSKLTPDPNAKGFASQWNIGYSLFMSFFEMECLGCCHLSYSQTNKHPRPENRLKTLSHNYARYANKAAAGFIGNHFFLFSNICFEIFKECILTCDTRTKIISWNFLIVHVSFGGTSYNILHK